MNYLSIIIPPIIGAIIGYITNWLAVKMMFRPLKPIKIGKFTLPFTPGLIPKSKPRLAKALGKAVSTNLLSNDDFIKALLSDNILDSIHSKTEDLFTSNSLSLENTITSISSKDTFNSILEKSSDKITFIVLNKLKENNIGKLIYEQIQLVANEKLNRFTFRNFGWKVYCIFFRRTYRTSYKQIY